MQAHPATTAIPPTEPLDAHRPKPGLHLAFGKGARLDHRVAALGGMAVCILGLGIGVRWGNWVSVSYAHELNSSKSSTTLQSTDRHDILG